MLDPDTALPTNQVDHDGFFGRDFFLSYAMENRNITGAVLHNATDSGGEFVMFVGKSALS